jgi:hypothetical protein
MEPLRFLGLLSELITSITGLFLMFFVYRKNPDYTGNKLISISIGSVGMYTLFVFIYDIIQKEWAIKFFLPIAISFIVIGAMLFYFTMKVLIYSTKWFEKKIKWGVFIIIVLIFIIVINFGDFVTVTNLNPVNSSFDLIPLSIMALLLFYFILASLYYINTVAIKILEGIAKKRIMYFRLGLYIFLLSLCVNVVTNLFDNMEILDLVFYFLLFIGEGTFAYAFLFKNDEKK